MNQIAYELFICCVQTGLKTKIAGPFASEDKINDKHSMFSRHISQSVRLEITHGPIELNSLSLKDFGSTLAAEKEQIESLIRTCSVKIFEQDPKIMFLRTDLVGSIYHQGYVNKLFAVDCPHMHKVKEWIRLIGTEFNPSIISRLTGSALGQNIYLNNFYTFDVKNICEYCHMLFGVNKFAVARLFVKNDPTKFRISTKEHVFTRALNLEKVASIHAENGDIDLARIYYEACESYPNMYAGVVDAFNNYVWVNKTSILFSGSN